MRPFFQGADGDVNGESDDNVVGSGDYNKGLIGMSAKYSPSGGNGKDDNGDKPKPKPKRNSNASRTLKRGASIAGAVFLFGGGPFDPFTDVGAGTIMVGTLLTATVVWLFYNNSTGNDSYPGPWTYSYEDPSQNPIHYQPGGMGNNRQFPGGWNNGWIKAFLAAAAVHKFLDTYKSYMDSMKKATDKVRMINKYPTFSASPKN